MTPTERAITRAGLTFEMADVLDDLGDTRRGIAGVTDDLCRLRTCRDALIVRAVTLGGPREAIAAVTAFVGGLNAAASAAAQAKGVDFVAPPDDGLGVCAPWAARRVSALGPVTGDDAVPVHPTSLGHAAVAEAVAGAM